MLRGKWASNPGLTQECMLFPWHQACCPPVCQALRSVLRIQRARSAFGKSGGTVEAQRPREEPSLRRGVGGVGHPLVPRGNSSALRTTELVFLRSLLSQCGLGRCCSQPEKGTHAAAVLALFFVGCYSSQPPYEVGILCSLSS